MTNNFHKVLIITSTIIETINFLLIIYQSSILNTKYVLLNLSLQDSHHSQVYECGMIVVFPFYYS